VTEVEPIIVENENGPTWRRRAVSRSLDAARSREEDPAQQFLDAAFELIDAKGTTEFTIQEVIDRSNQSRLLFYRLFDGKDELLLALVEESVRDSIEDLRAVVEAETGPLGPAARLRNTAARVARAGRLAT
jgi:AcrR family transcriptional regulator